MTRQERWLRLCDHPAKWGADAVAIFIAAVLFWQQHLIRAALVAVIVPTAASFCVMRLANVQAAMRWRWGPLEARHVTPVVLLVRTAAMVVLWGGAWYQSVAVCLVALLVVAATCVRVDLADGRESVRLPAGSLRLSFALFSDTLDNHQLAVALALLVSSLASVIVFYLAGHSFRGYLLENADLLYLPTLFSDLLARGGHLSDWFLTPAPYFFPDYPTYFVAYLLAAGTYSRILMFSIAQTLLTFCAIWFLAKQVSAARALILAVTITIGLTWFALNAGEPFVIQLASASHYGGFVSSLLFAAVWIRYIASNEHSQARVWLSLVCVLAFVSALSDNFFIVHTVVPFIATAALVNAPGAGRRGRQARWVVIAAGTVLALVIPALIYRMPIPPPSINVAWSPAVDDQKRATLESRFHLVDGDFRGDRLWTYRLVDTTRTNVSALVGDPDVEDTQHVDRQSFVVDGAQGALSRAMSSVPVGGGLALLAVLCAAFGVRALNDFRRRDPFGKPAAVILAAVFSGLGSLSYRVVVANPTRYPPAFGLEKTYTNVTDVYLSMARAMASHPTFGTVFIAYVALAGLLLYDPVGRSGERENSREPLVWLTTFSTLSVVATCVAVSLMTDLPVMSRYLIPVFCWPVVVGVLLAADRVGPRFGVPAMSVSLLAVISLGSGAFNLARHNGVTRTFYTSDMRCIDNALERQGLRNGIAQYWDAKYLQQFSRLDLSLAQYLENLDTMPWITSKRYFRDSYDFAIVSEDAEPTYRISAEVLARLNGSAQQVLRCGSRSLYIYGKGRLRTTTDVARGPR